LVSPNEVEMSELSVEERIAWSNSPEIITPFIVCEGTVISFEVRDVARDVVDSVMPVTSFVTEIVSCIGTASARPITSNERPEATTRQVVVFNIRLEYICWLLGLLALS
jgi:hypothetical protein